jgi:hypothetical protein
MPCGKSFWDRKNLLRQNCSHPRANAFLIDFGAILRSKIPILRVKARRKMQKCIALGQFGSIPVRLPNHSLRRFRSFMPEKYTTAGKISANIPIDSAENMCYTIR